MSKQQFMNHYINKNVSFYSTGREVIKASHHEREREIEGERDSLKRLMVYEKRMNGWLDLVWSGWGGISQIKEIKALWQGGYRGSLHKCLLSCVGLFVSPWAVALQASLSVEFFRQEYWSGLPFPPPGDLLDPGIEPVSCTGRKILYHWAT